MNNTEIMNCGWMAALGLVVREGVVTSIGERDQVQANIIANMTAAAKLYQGQEGKEHTNAVLYNLSGEFQDNEDHNPVRQALWEGMLLFERLATLIFLPDPPHCNIRELPQKTFAEVPYFYDLSSLAKQAGYDLSNLGIQVVGETGERAAAFNRKTTAPNTETHGVEIPIDAILKSH